MRNTYICLTLIAALLMSGCGGGLDGDMKKSESELQKAAADMSDSDLESRMKEAEERAEKLGKSVGDEGPSEADEAELMNLVKVASIYGDELRKRKMKMK